MSRRQWILTAICLCLVFALCSPLIAGDKKKPAAAPAVVSPTGTGTGPADPKAYVLAQFGSALKYLPKFPPIVADFDQDGTEDIVLVVTGKDPLIDEAEFHYKTIDPYNGFFGWGDPKDTLQFATAEAEPHFLAIVHNWKADTPKAKFVMINLVFEKMYFARYVNKKKKVLPCIEVEDRTQLTSDVFWDGKKWKWADRSLKIE